VHIFEWSIVFSGGLHANFFSRYLVANRVLDRGKHEAASLVEMRVDFIAVLESTINNYIDLSFVVELPD
jgi:hypothetical protein